MLQAALIAASVPVVYPFALRRMPRSGALVVAVAYAVSWAIQAMVDFDFHEVAWGVPILAVAIDALDRRDDRTLLIVAGLLLLVREDMGVVLVMLGLLRLALARPGRTGCLLIGGGLAGYLLVTALVIPAFAPERAVRLLDVRRARAGPAARAVDHRGASGAHRPAVLHPVDQGRDAGATSSCRWRCCRCARATA